MLTDDRGFEGVVVARQVQDVLNYARQLADELDKDMKWEPRDHQGYGGCWKARDETLAPKIAARVVSALDFFRQYAGEGSLWTARATAVYQNEEEAGTQAVGELLRAWADQVDAGITEVAGSRAWAEIGVASTDVMGQVRRLLTDPKNHPAAAIVLCGAALEMALRAVVDARGLAQPSRPGMTAHATLLRSEGLIAVQDLKELEQCAGVRNLAAHGEFDSLSHERAGLMEQQTNLLLRRLADLLQIAPNAASASPVDPVVASE
jgi:hypothetical protein